MSQAQHEYQVMRELEEIEHARTVKAIDDAIYQRSIATKWPSVLLWPGKNMGLSAPVNADISKEKEHGLRS